MDTNNLEIVYKTVSNETVFVKDWFIIGANKQYMTIGLIEKNISEIIKIPFFNPYNSKISIELFNNKIRKITIPPGIHTVSLENNPLEEIHFEDPLDIDRLNIFNTPFQNFSSLNNLTKATILVSPYHKINSQLGLLKFEIFN